MQIKAYVACLPLCPVWRQVNPAIKLTEDIFSNTLLFSDDQIIIQETAEQQRCLNCISSLANKIQFVEITYEDGDDSFWL